MSTMEIGCIVHDRKYLSQFHGSVNQLRRTKEFPISILQQLSKRCCSCRGQTGESSFTVDHLTKLCHNMQSSEGTLSVISTPAKAIHYVALDFPSTLTLIQRKYKAGRFVGRKGAHLQRLERTLNVRINILDRKSYKGLRNTVNQLQKTNKQYRVTDLWMLITIKDENNVEKVKNSIINEWKNIDVITKKKRSMTNRSFGEVIPPSTYIEGDSRWKPKTHKNKQRKQKQRIQPEEVEPQPQLRPLSMPKQIIKIKH